VDARRLNSIDPTALGSESGEVGRPLASDAAGRLPTTGSLTDPEASVALAGKFI
jgi:hypothetical protein